MSSSTSHLDRRAFLRGGTLVLLTAGVGFRDAPAAAAESDRPAARIGLLTDLHYADKPAAGTRYYRETPAKLDEALACFEKERPDFIVELGDLVDSAPDVETELRWLGLIQERLAKAAAPRHLVLGNHCVDTLTKEEFLGVVGQPAAHYSFDRSGFHFVILDACYRGDGQLYGRKNSKWDDANIPAAELEWLKADLGGTSLPTIVFAHQRLDGEDKHCVRNAAEVRRILEAEGSVLAVFQGHSHHNDHQQVASIHYVTLAALIEGSGDQNNAYSIADLAADGTIQVRGFRRQVEYEWKRV